MRQFTVTLKQKSNNYGKDDLGDRGIKVEYVAIRVDAENVLDAVQRAANMAKILPDFDVNDISTSEKGKNCD